MNKFAELIAKANEAGKAAAEACAPEMMCVKEGSTGKVYGPFPVCGFAWIVVRPNRGAFAKFLKERAGFSNHYAGGISNWISDYEQSLDMKTAHAYAYAKVLRDAGYEAYADSRID